MLDTKRELIKHILVTGPSGSGKSTYARNLAKAKGLTHFELNDTNTWKNAFKEHGHSLTKKDLGTKNYDQIRKEVLKEALKSNKARSILEGSQVFGDPEEVLKHELHLMMTPRELSVKRRLKKRIWERKQKGKPPKDPVYERARAEMLFDENKDVFDRFKKIPGIKKVYT